MSNEYIEWVKQGLKQPGKNQTGLARALGLTHPQASRIVRGLRRIKVDEVPIIAEYLGTRPPGEDGYNPDLATDQSCIPPQRLRSVRPAVRGVVSAGNWLEHDVFFDSQEQHYPHDVFVPHGIDPSAVYMLRVEGSSVNRKVASGGYVLCLPIESAPRNFKSGDWVVAERRRGDLLEWTVKQVKRSDEGHWELLPCSDDPRYQSALVLGDKDNETVSVKAFVLDFISPGTHF